MEDPITVLLIDDQPMIAEAVRRMLLPEADITFHYCSDPTQAIKVARSCQPTVILQDLVMPEMEGTGFSALFAGSKLSNKIRAADCAFE